MIVYGNGNEDKKRIFWNKTMTGKIIIKKIFTSLLTPAKTWDKLSFSDTHLGTSKSPKLKMNVQWILWKYKNRWILYKWSFKN